MIIYRKRILEISFLFYRQDQEEKKPKAAGNKMTAPVFSGKPKDVVRFAEYIFLVSMSILFLECDRW
jgi:hypothetical protein